MGLKKIILVLTALAGLSKAFNTLSPWDKEVIYNWKALVKAGTNLPTSYASHFVLEGKIHVQANSNATHVKITDLSYKLYNGILNHVQEHEAHSVPLHLKELEHVFKIIYDTKGLAIGIVTEAQEKEFSRNIKKAIATIFQMDESVLKQVHHHPHSFVIKEHSIYGHFDVDYTIKPHQNEIEVHKLHDMHDPHHLYLNLFSNNEAGVCDMGYENPIMHNTKKQYRIVKQDGHHVVKDIHSAGVVFYYPFKGQSDHQFIFVNQSMHLTQMVPIQEQFHIQSEHVENHLTYHSIETSQDGSIHDVTNGRHVVNYEKLIPNIQHMLGDIHSYLNEDHIHTREPDSKRGQMVNRVQRLLQFFSLTKLEELHKKLSGDSLTVFHHILPLVGTKSSTLFIKQLIVNKVLSAGVASELLQHFPEHVIEPTVELLAEMEDLLHLDESISWNVRKVAVLSFASLVQHSHSFVEKTHRNKEFMKNDGVDIHHHETKYSRQQPYEKYVIEYINKLRSSHDYKVQMTYLMGLCNMRLHSIIKHLLPAVYGEWYPDHHFRLLSLWAVSTAVVEERDPNTVIETLWPIFTNVDELTEMRTIAFYFIMMTYPNDSRLTNMFNYLLMEPNDEVYSFVYTFMHGMMETNEPCHREYAVKVAHLVKLLPPRSHGRSFATRHDYKDVNFDFSAGVENYFINGSDSQIYGVVTTSQQFNIYHEDRTFFVKIHGVDHHIDPVNMAVEVFQKKIPKITDNKDVHIEVVLLRHGHIVNTYFFDQHSLHQLNEILDFFTKESHSLTQDLLHVSYNEYHRNLIPTDLGIPALWEYLMPVVHHNNISVTKETVNKVVHLHVDNRYVNWIHYRHGLSFYNPFVDVWQGINRYHSYDAVWPLHFEITLNTQQQSLQLSWKKDSNPAHNVAGFRSHVKQMVFIKDDYNRNILMQSCPQCKDFQIVSHGEKFRNDYPLIQDDDLSTGHQWRVGIYDSSQYATNGSFYHQMYLFTQSHSSHSESPLRHLWMSYANWHQYCVLLPEPGTYGFIVRVEPSHQHSVSNIDLSLRLHSDATVDDDYYYAPKGKWSTRMTYSVKNQETSLKTWDVNAILDMNSGHTHNTVKMHVTRIVPGQKDYKVCVDGIKKWTESGVEGHLNVAMSQTPDGKCVKDDTVIDVTMTGQQSHEQEQGHHKYGSCEYVNYYAIAHYHTTQCLVDHTTVRHYVYNVKTTNVPTEFKKVFAHWWDHVKSHYMSYYVFEDEHSDNIADQNLKVDVMYPMQVEEVNLHVTTPQHVYKLTGVPTHYWKWFGVAPDSVEYPEWFQYLHQVGFVEHCTVHHNHYHLNHHDIREAVPNDWTLYVGNAVQNPQKAVYVKQVGDDEIGVKVVDHGHTLEIVPHGDGHQVTIDGQVVPIHEYLHKDWMYCHMFIQDSHHPVALIFQHSGIHVEYHHHQAVIVIPKVDQQLHGRCYDHN
jgi:hypothetical protein